MSVFNSNDYWLWLQGLRKFYELVMQAILRHVRFDGMRISYDSIVPGFYSIASVILSFTSFSD